MERNKTKLINKLLKKICKKESGKKSYNIRETRELLKLTAHLLINDYDFHSDFIAYLQTMDYNLQ